MLSILRISPGRVSCIFPQMNPDPIGIFFQIPPGVVTCVPYFFFSLIFLLNLFNIHKRTPVVTGSRGPGTRQRRPYPPAGYGHLSVRMPACLWRRILPAYIVQSMSAFVATRALFVSDIMAIANTIATYNFKWERR